MTWTAQIVDLLTPLEDYTRLHAATLRRFGGQTIDLSFPNPQFLTDPRPFQTLASVAADAGPTQLRHSPFGGFTTVRRRIATALSGRQHLPYAWSDIIMTPGAGAALTVVLRTLFNPPDRIMLVSPCWMDYPLYLAQLGLGCDIVPSREDKHLDVEAIERSWTAQTRGIVISQPASPTGVVYSTTELNALATVLRGLSHRGRQPPILIADEAHSGEIWDDITCPSPSTVYPETISVHSVGKAWGMPGQRIGYLAVSPHITPDLRSPRRLEQAMRLSGHCAPTSLMQHLAAALAGATPNTAKLGDLQHHARGRLHRLGVEFIDAHATRFLYARCPRADDLSFVTDLAERGVLTMPSTLFHEPGWFRLALNVPFSELDRGISLISEVAATYA